MQADAHMTDMEWFAANPERLIRVRRPTEVEASNAQNVTLVCHLPGFVRTFPILTTEKELIFNARGEQRSEDYELFGYIEEAINAMTQHREEGLAFLIAFRHHLLNQGTD